jgi:hypothetical protein
MAEKYFAGYVLDADTTKSVDDQILLAKSTDENSLVEEQLQKILMSPPALHSRWKRATS